MSDRQGATQRVIDYLTARPGQYVSALTLEPFSRCAWRTRVSNARKILEAEGKGTIDNKLTWLKRADGSTWVKSEYAFLPSRPVSLLDLVEQPTG